MSRPARLLALASLLACTGLGCGAEPLTQIVVVVDSDWDGFERVELEITGFEQEATVNAGARENEPVLPRRVALVHEGGPLGPISVTARAYAAEIDEPVLVEPRTSVMFMRGETRVLEIDLLFECIGLCRADQACVAGRDCLDSGDERVNGLAPWTGEVGTLDVIYRVRDGDVVDEGDGGGGAMPIFGDGSLRDAAGPDGPHEGGAGEGGSPFGPDADVDAGPVLPTPAYDYAPSNFDPMVPEIRGIARADVMLDCGTSEFDSTELAFSNWCGAEPAALVIDQAGGGDVAVLVMDTLTVAAGSVLRLSGSRPVVLAVFGDARIAGTVDASARGETPGPGADRSCDGGQGSTGANSGDYSGAGGGSGGGFGSGGGDGGPGGDGVGSAGAAVSGGIAVGNAALTPLRGGCSGGRGGSGTNAIGAGAPGGGGGGAVQISAAGTLDVYGRVIAAGGGGDVGASSQNGGGGGGSGGAIVLEGAPLDIDGAAVISANGGGGGAGQPSSGSNASRRGSDGVAGVEIAAGGEASGSGGEGGPGAARVAEAAAGSTGGSNWPDGAGGGGGGGGVGRIRLNGGDSCAARGVFSPFASVSCPGCSPCPEYPALGCSAHARADRVYYLCEGLSWDAARARCEAAQLALVRIDDQAENEFITGAIVESTWIGASDGTIEGEWRWTDGVAFWSGAQNGAPVSSRYSAWSSDQPDDASLTQSPANCALIDGSGDWYDRTCETEHAYMCEPP